MEINDGGKAFPCYPHAGDPHQDTCGMSLRDHLAAKALSGLPALDEVVPEKAAMWCYKIADAMLAARDAK